MKKQICIAVALIVASIVTGCSNNFNLVKNDTTKKTNIKIGVTVYDQYDTFIDSLLDSLNSCAKEKEQQTGVTITVDIVNASGSQITQNEQVENFADKDYDMICVNLVDRTDTSVIIDKAKTSNIPIIFFNRELVEEDLERWEKLYYVGAMAVESGILQGEIVTNLWVDNKEELDKNQDGKMQYVMLEGEAGHQDASVRTEYSVNTIMDSGIQVDKLANGIANWNRAQATTKMGLWMEKYKKEIEVVIANNDDMALGALDALRNARWAEEDYPVIVGIDGTEEALNELQAGRLTGTVLNDEHGQANGILELAYSLVMGIDLPEDIQLIDGKYIRIPYKQVTKENIDGILEEVNSTRKNQY